jgi:hypothetical protein
VKTTAVCAALIILTLGCGSTKSSDPNIDAWEREVQILSPGQIGDRQYEELGGLLEEYVTLGHSFGNEEAAIDNAKRRLKRRAAERDADAVVILECGRHVRRVEQSTAPSTGPEVVCHGAAIRWMN